MDRPAPTPPQQRDIVYCHQCENEWYRDEHGMTPCPECGGDFTEVVEEGSDPRDVPDPEEDDIGQFEWRNNEGGPGRQLHGTFTQSLSLNDLARLQQGQQGGFGGGLFGLIGGALQTALGGAQQARALQQQQQQQQAHDHGQGSPPNENARSAPGSPLGSQEGQQSNPQPGVFVRHSEGPGFSYTIRSNVTLHPRDPNGPQPTQNQPDDIDRLMTNMLANIGAQTGRSGNFRFGPPQFGDDDGHLDGNYAGPFANIFRMLGMPVGGVHGDAVYSQEAFDRIISQMMEQNTSGNAPGPASQQAIDSLPKRKILQSDMDDEGKADCTICMEDVPLGEEVTVLPCQHWFHFDCIKMWLTEHDTCPHCRRGIMPRDQAAGTHARSPSQAPLNDMHSPEYQGQRMPGGFPFPDSISGSQSADAPHANATSASESPQQERRSSAGGMFSRMRDTFGGGSGGGGSGGSPGDGHPR